MNQELRSFQQLRTAHDYRPTTCQRKVWRSASEGGRVVPANHPGAFEISCGKCLACQIVLRNRLIGRMLSEKVVSAEVAFLTLTYAPVDHVDPEGARVIMPEHMVAFRKSMRDRHGQAQYCGAAELGELKGRVHWHMLWFFRDGAGVPEWVRLPGQVERAYRDAFRSGRLDARGGFRCCGVRCEPQVSRKDGKRHFIAWLPEWPHGYVNIREVDDRAPGYIAKYMLKPSKSAVLRGEKSPHNSLDTYRVVSSKLGYEFMRQLGERTAKAGLAPASYFSVAGRRFAYGPRKGQLISYTMTRGMKRELLQGYGREIAGQLARGELAKWVAPITDRPGDAIGWGLEEDARRDPRHAAELFFAKLGRGRRGQRRLPYLDLGPIVKAVSTPDQGQVVKTARGEFVFSWPDLSGHGRDVHIPIQSRRELVRAVRTGGVAAFGLHPPGLRPGDVAPDAPKTMRGRFGERVPLPVREKQGKLMRRLKLPLLRLPLVGDGTVFPLFQVLEHGGAGIASEADRVSADWLHSAEVDQWKAAGRVGRFPKRRRLFWKVQRAFATERQLDGLRQRIIGLMLARWSPPAAELAAGRRAAGWPGLELLSGASVTPDFADRWPLFARWMREAAPDAAPF